MIPVVVGTGQGTPNLLTFRSLAINNPSDDAQSTYRIEEIAESDIWQQAFEPLPNRDGAQGYEPFAMHKMFQVRGWVHATSLGQLFDKIETLNATFHPVNCYLADTSTFNRGYLPIDFNVPTADTANYPSGFIPSRYYVQALRLPVQVESKFDSLSARIDFLLRAIDPRRYLQTSSTGNRTGNGTLVINNSLATYRSWPIITMVLDSSTPTGTATISTSTGSQVVTINLAALSASTTYHLDMEARTFKSAAGTSVITAVVGGSQFFDLLAQSQTLTFAGFDSGTQFTVTWRRAFL